MTKNFEELDDAFNVTSEIVPTDTAEVGITKPERHIKSDIEKFKYPKRSINSK